MLKVTLMTSKYSYIDDIESRQYVIDSLSHNFRLSDWEKTFIADIKRYVERGGFLSSNQKQKLSDIWEKY